MGKKKKRKKLAKKINAMVDKDDTLSTQEIFYAGVGVLAKAADKGSRKVYRKAVKKGRRMLDFEMPALDDLLIGNGTGDDDSLSDPVIAYRHHGGGWFDIEVGGLIVDRVQGEEDAAAKAGALLEAFAAQDSDAQQTDRTEVMHVGGGWYVILIQGVPIDRVRGQEDAEERYQEILALN